MNRGEQDEKKTKGGKEAELDEELDDALEATFPASDPVAVGHESRKADRPADRRAPVIDLEEVRRLARKVKDR